MAQPVSQIPGAPRSGNQSLALIIIAVLAVMLIPMPPLVLDLLLCLNITLSLLILMAVLNASKPTDFSTFPSVLLFTALFRLSLNVASTRLILLSGDPGKVIQAFGDFVIGGEYVVGIIIFLILVVIQFVVITKGQNRISEVAARFTLDAMPGKQMAVDADLSAGIINTEEAKARRKELSHEAEFYGAMDGAGKFVRGDAVAGLIITVINIIGGLVMGVVMKGMDVSGAFATYTILTVGDGLVSQVPGLVVSTGSGLLVTKSNSDAGLGHEMGNQILRQPTALRSVAAIVMGLGFLPGMPILPFTALAAGLYSLGNRPIAPPPPPDEDADEAEGDDDAPAAVEDLLNVDRLGIEIGYRLISLVEDGKHGGLLDHIRSLRRQFATTHGLVVPPIRVRDNIQIDPNSYQVLLGGQAIAKGELRAGHFLAMDPSGTCGPIEGVDTIEPAFGLPAKWISENDKDRAEVQGYTVIDAPSVLVTHLTEVLKSVAHELLTRDDVKNLVDNLRKTAPAVIDELVPSQLSLGQLQNVLSALLREQVSIRNLQTIMEAVADSVPESKDLRLLTERARGKLARTILEPLVDDSGTLHAAVIDPDLERGLADAVNGAEGLANLAPGFLSRLVDSTAAALADMAKQGRNPVLLTRASLRPLLAEAIAGAIPGATVLSYQETAPAARVETSTRVAVHTG
ncbi:MAG: flagellar biosynthesis protein FlhA [Planctomycetota bacterium]